MPTRKTDPPSKENNEKGSNDFELTALARTDQFEEAATKTMDRDGEEATENPLVAVAAENDEWTNAYFGEDHFEDNTMHESPDSAAAVVATGGVEEEKKPESGTEEEEEDMGGDSSLRGSFIRASETNQKKRILLVVRYLLGLGSFVVVLLFILTANHPGGIEPVHVAIDLEFLVFLAFPAAFILAFLNFANNCAVRYVEYAKLPPS